jgi:hypothetical protein
MPPFDHQIAGIKAIVRQPYFALFDEMGAGKTKQLIDAAQVLYTNGVINRVLVIAPASVRTGVWFDDELGELARHLWLTTPATITEFHSKVRTRQHGPETSAVEERLQWVITNYEFIRPIDYSKIKETGRGKDHRLSQIMPFCTKMTLLVLDESSAIKNARQPKRRRACNCARRAGGSFS